MIPKIGPNVAWQIVDGEAIVVDLGTGKAIGLNASGTFLWSQVDGNRDSGMLAAAIAREFDVTDDEAMADIDEFLTLMQSRELIVDAAESA